MQPRRKKHHEFALIVIFNSGKKQILATGGSRGLKENILAIYGLKFLQTLMPVDLTIQSAFKSEEGAADAVITGWISKPSHGHGRSTDRQLFFINERPCALPKVRLGVYTAVY